MEDKKQEIIEKTMRLFCDFGIKSVSMDDIARELGMSKKTLYQYIKDKNELVRCGMEYAEQKMGEILTVFDREDLNAIEQLFEYSEILAPEMGRYKPTIKYDLRKYYPDLLKHISDKRRQFVYEMHLKNLRKGKKEGFYNKDINEDVIARLILSHNLYTFDEEYGIFNIAEINDKSIVTEGFKYHFRGICTEKGMTEVKRLFKAYIKE